MPEAHYSTHPITFAISYESTQGQPPGYVETTAPAGSTAQWATDEAAASTAFRMRVESADPSWIRGESAIEDKRMRARIFQVDKKIHGLRNGDGGALSLTLHGTEATASAGNQVAETALSKFLGHCLGGVAYTNSTTAALVSTDVSYDLTVSTNADEGLVVVPMHATTGLGHPQRILTLSTDTVGTWPEIPGTLANTDVVSGAAIAYIDPDALMSPADANASTVSVHYENAGQSWDAAGCRVQLDEITFAVGETPSLKCTIGAGATYPPGDGGIGSVTWTGSVTGAAGLVTGSETFLVLTDKGTTTRTTYCVQAIKVTPGVPAVRATSVTECGDNLEGMSGWVTAPADTIIEVTALIDTSHQDDWDTDQAKALLWYQSAAAGAGWFVLAPECYLMESPEPAEHDGTRTVVLRYRCHEDESLDATASDLNSARSKLQIGMY
jgi:hypothetical protein